MPPRLKPTRLEYVVDGVRLRAQLSAAALDAAAEAKRAGASRAEAISAVLVGLPAGGNGVIASLPAAVAVFDPAEGQPVSG